jgi:hypothetical protein
VSLGISPTHATGHHHESCKSDQYGGLGLAETPTRGVYGHVS